MDGIPDASGLQYPKPTGQDGHRYASGQSTLYASGYRVCVDGKPRAQLLCRDGNAFDHTTCGRYLKIRWSDGHRFFTLVRENFAEPPDATRHRKHRAEDAYRYACHQARE